ncbi:hypothetical protein [Flavobacterium sp. WC2509]|uniref:hypothetical protein n=1 Tax=Flavobacterium sp. WC2509 TaxID=3461406 RepID=UPI004043FA3F
MKVKNYLLLMYFIAITSNTILAQDNNAKTNFFGDRLKDPEISENHLTYKGVLEADDYIAFLKELKTKDSDLSKNIESLLKVSGFSNGFENLNSTNVKFVKKIKNADGTYGTVDKFSKVDDFGGIMNAFLVNTQRGPIYFLTSGYLFYSTDYDLIYDFQNEELRGNNGKRIKDFRDVKVQYNKPFRLKVINVNRYLYNVKATFDDEFLVSNEPELFKKLFKGEGFDMSLLTGLATSDAEAAAGFMGQDDETKKLLASYLEFKKKYNALLSNYINAYSVCLPEPVPCCEEKKGAENFKQLSEELATLNINNLAVSIEVTTNLSQAEKDKTDLTAKLEKAAAKEKPGIQKKLQDNTNEITKLTAQKLILAELSKILADITDDKLSILVLFDNNFIAENYQIAFPAVYPKGDNLIFGLDIEPNNNEVTKKLVNVPLKEIHLKDDLRVRNKWFYSFSTGPFVGLGEKFREDEYGWQAQPGTSGVIDDTSSYKIISNGRSGLPIGISAMANYGVKLSNFYGLGGSIGVGATINENVHPAYFFGVTNFFGQDKQFNVTLGLAFIETEKLKKDLYPGIGTQLYNAPIDLEYTKKMEEGFFVALSYTVFSSTKVNRVRAGNTTVTPTVSATSEAAAVEPEEKK